MDIPVPVPNTEVKHPRADDTPIRGKVGSRRLFLFKIKKSLDKDPEAGGKQVGSDGAAGKTLEKRFERVSSGAVLRARKPPAFSF